MAFVITKGIAIHHWLAGRRGTPRLGFLNSLGPDLGIWDDVVACLTDSFDILLVDKRGHGLSETTLGPYSIPLLADDLTALLDAIGWRSASIAGLLIGGLVAQHLAIHVPECVERLVLMDTAAQIGTTQVWNKRIAAVQRGGLQAPHITVWIVARGINLGLHTRVYFSDEAEANSADSLLNRIGDLGRRVTLVASRTERDGLPVFTFDVRL